MKKPLRKPRHWLTNPPSSIWSSDFRLTVKYWHKIWWKNN